MKRTTILVLSVLLLCVTASHTPAAPSASSGQAKPHSGQAERLNVLFIAIDDLNDWTGMLKGNPQARTPHMDRLAAAFLCNGLGSCRLGV